MITAMVRFPLRPGTTLADAKALYEQSAPNYRGVSGLVRKYYLFGEDGSGGGVYLWTDRAAAERFYSEAWRAMLTQRFGAPPEIRFFDTPVIVDNASDTATIAAA